MELTAEDLRKMVFGAIKAHLDPHVDEAETVYVQLAEGEGIGDEGSDELEDHCDYRLDSTCRGVQVRFVVEMSDEQEEQAVNDLPEPRVEPAPPP